MNDRISARGLLLAALIAITFLAPRNSDATVVEFQTVMGNFEVNLYDNATPETVANFLAYVDSGAYTSSIYHRSVAGFVIQGGGFTFNMDFPLNEIPANAPVINEPVYANVRGTIAMAKRAGDPDSATSQWYFNLDNNSNDLDSDNGGFTVFGEVVGDGMDVVVAIADLQTFNFGDPLASLPLRDYSSDDFTNNVPVEEEHLVLITAIVVSDTMVDTAAGLNPTPTTAGSGGGGGLGGGGGGGGTLNYWAIFMLFAMMLGRQAISPRN